MPQPASQKNRAILAFACVYFFWGSTYSAIHIAGLHIAPPLVGATRSLISTLIMAAICMARGVSLRVTRAAAWRLMMVGILIMTVNNLLLIWGETMVATGYASLVIAMTPIFIAILETLLPGGETLNLRGWAGTMLGGIGMAALLWPALHHSGGAATGHRTIFGFVILIVAAFATAVASVASRRFRFQVDTLVATTWQIGAAGLINLAISAGGGCFRTAHWTTGGMLAIGYLSIFGSVVGLTAYTYLLQHVPVTKVATYAFVNPVVAVLIGVVLFRERLAHAEILGMLLIIAAVATVIFSRTKSAPPPSDPLLELPIEE